MLFVHADDHLGHPSLSKHEGRYFNGHAKSCLPRGGPSGGHL